MCTMWMTFLDAKYKAEFALEYMTAVITDIMFFVAVIQIFGK